MSASVGALVLAASLLFGAVVPPAPVPTERVAPAEPEVTAISWVLLDVASGEILDGENQDRSLPMASVTKMMTALVVRDRLDLEDRVRISPTAADTGEAEIGLVPGERWSVEDLLFAMLVRSGNDAAVALAEAAGGSVADFAELMNAKAESLGLTGSSFVNPHGLDADDHFATASDLARIGAAVLTDPVLAEMVRTRVVVFKDAPDGSARIAVNTNLLLGVYPGIIGIKTGFTGDAGKVLVAAVDTPQGLIVSAVMGSGDHFSDSRELLEYGRQLGSYLEFIASGSNGTLPTGRDQTTQLADTAIGEDIASALRTMLPVVLGGTG